MKKRRYLNKPCFRPISVKGLTGFSYGQDDPLHGRAQHHLPQQGTKQTKRREERFKRRAWKDRWAACWRKHLSICCRSGPTPVPKHTDSTALYTMSRSTHFLLCTRTAQDKLFLCILFHTQMTKHACLQRSVMALLKDQAESELSVRKCLRWEFPFSSVVKVYVLNTQIC